MFEIFPDNIGLTINEESDNIDAFHAQWSNSFKFFVEL